MATTIALKSANIANAPSKLGSPPDFGTLYSGRALDFDGVADYIDTGQSFSGVITESHTMSAWIKPDDGQASDAQAFLGTVDEWTGYNYFRVDSDGKLRYAIGTATAKELELVSPVFFANGAADWTHVVATFSKSSATAGTITIYANGVSLGSSSSPDASWNTDNYVNEFTFYIGARNNEDTALQFYAGKMANVQVWNSALS